MIRSRSLIIPLPREIPNPCSTSRFELSVRSRSRKEISKIMRLELVLVGCKHRRYASRFDLLNDWQIGSEILRIIIIIFLRNYRSLQLCWWQMWKFRLFTQKVALNHPIKLKIHLGFEIGYAIGRFSTPIVLPYSYYIYSNDNRYIGSY